MPNSRLAKALKTRWTAQSASAQAGGLHLEEAPNGTKAPYTVFELEPGEVRGRTVASGGDATKASTTISSRVTGTGYAKGGNSAGTISDLILNTYLAEGTALDLGTDYDLKYWRYVEDYPTRPNQSIVAWVCVFDCLYSYERAI